MSETALDRFLRYVKIITINRFLETTPSTAKQFDLQTF